MNQEDAMLDDDLRCDVCNGIWCEDGFLDRLAHQAK